MTPTSSSSFLLVGNHQTYSKESLQGEGAHLDCFEICHSQDAASAILAESQRALKAIFVSSGLEDPTAWLRILMHAHEKRAGVPLFLIREPKFSQEESVIRETGIQKILSGPTTLVTLLHEFDALAAQFNMKEALEKGRLNNDAIGSTTRAKDSDFAAVRADNFLSGSRGLFDVYIRLGPDKYVKIVQVGDKLELERVQSYLAKNVKHFYIRKEAQELYVRYCASLTQKIVTMNRLPVSFKVAQTLNLGHETLNLIESAGLTDSTLSQSLNFVSSVQTVLSQFNPKEDGVLGPFLSDVASYEHGSATAMIASLLIEGTDIQSNQAVNIVGMTALLHDIGLLGLPDSVKSEDPAQMTAEELSTFRKHPEIGAEKLRKVPRLPPAIAQAVAQHHMRRGGQGFPAGAAGMQINTVAEIVGISDEFVQALKRARSQTSFDPIKHMETSVFSGFSGTIVRNFQKQFILKASLNRGKQP
jgi:HD-GYP domain-containing protein (c-di-GMP phosphodiesterase class II)